MSHSNSGGDRVGSSSDQRVRRMLKILRILDSGKVCQVKNIALECDCSSRQIERDVAFLRTCGYEISTVYKQGYKILTPARLPVQAIAEEGLLALLLFAREFGDAQKGIPVLRDNTKEATQNLLRIFPEEIVERVKQLAAPIAILGEPKNPLLERTELFYNLDVAIAERCPVRLHYKSLFPGEENQPIVTKIQGYALVYHQCWYLVGRSTLHGEVRKFNLGRIEDYEVLDGDEPYEIPSNFTVENYLGNAWRLIRDTKRQTVRLRFDKMVAENVAEKSWHKTQECRFNSDGTLDVTFQLDGIREVFWWIFSYADQVEVLEPQELRDLVRESAKKMVEKHR